MNGKIVGKRFQIVRQIGQGGMGSVHEAIDAVTQARVAIKLIEAEMAKSATLMGRFEREARAAATLDTPHIVKVLDAGTDEETGLPFLVLEYLEGEDLQHLVRRLGPLAPDLALRIVAQGCLGLERAHQARIVHRDIKPANFFLAKTGDSARLVKLLDFGIAKITRDPVDSNAETAGLTRTGSMLGTPLYMSPEQARGYKGLDLRSDLWSLGVVLYQALTGRTPHDDTEALGDLIIAICTEEATPIQELAPWVPPDVAAIAQRAMRFAPDARFQSAAEMFDAIRPLLPEGWAIEESMLRPLGEGDCKRVEPRLVTAPDVPVGRGGTTKSSATTWDRPAPPRAAALTTSVDDGGSPAIRPPVETTRSAGIDPATPLPAGASSSGASLEGLGATLGSRVVSPAPARSPATGTRGVILGAGAAIVLGIGGVATLRVARAPQEATPPPAPTSVAAAPPTVAPPAVEARPRTVKVVVLPADAAVEVDGVAATPNDGAVEITGVLASVHKVRLKSGDAEILRDVVVTEGGAIPPKVELPATPGIGTRPLPAKLPAVKPATAGSALPLRQER